MLPDRATVRRETPATDPRSPALPAPRTPDRARSATGPADRAVDLTPSGVPGGEPAQRRVTVAE
jgi:hypothetical protein